MYKITILFEPFASIAIKLSGWLISPLLCFFHENKIDTYYEIAMIIRLETHNNYHRWRELSVEKLEKEVVLAA